MKIYEEKSLREFKAWTGGQYVLDKMIERGTVEDFEELVEELYPDGISNTELNDLLWFEDSLTADYIYDYRFVDMKVFEDGTGYLWYEREDGLNLFFETNTDPREDLADWTEWDSEKAKEWFDGYGKEV